jgi:hypothetical protein
LFVHQLPPKPTALRVRTWRRLHQLGAVPIKQAVYALPDTAESREDFEWLKAEVEGSGGQAVVFSANSIDVWSDDELVEAFRRSAHEAYNSLAEDLKKTMHDMATKSKKKGARAPAVGRLLDSYRERAGALERTDFFAAPGRDRVNSLLDQLSKWADRKTAPQPSRPAKHDDTDSASACG